MNELMLFTDGSVNTRSKIGYGAYLIITSDELSSESLKSQVNVKRFENTSPTKLESETLLWALKENKFSENKLNIYTDSQNIISLLGRRERLEQNTYRSQKNNMIRNHQLYKDFYKIIDLMDCKFIKVRGHKRSSQKNDIDQLFTLVDRASRNALRKEFLIEE